MCMQYNSFRIGGLMATVILEKTREAQKTQTVCKCIHIKFAFISESFKETMSCFFYTSKQQQQQHKRNRPSNVMPEHLYSMLEKAIDSKKYNKRKWNQSWEQIVFTRDVFLRTLQVNSPQCSIQ